MAEVHIHTHTKHEIPPPGDNPVCNLVHYILGVHKVQVVSRASEEMS